MKNCRACEIAIADDEVCDDLGLCALCAELNQLAVDFGYDEIRRALPLLEESLFPLRLEVYIQDSICKGFNGCFTYTIRVRR